MLTTRGWIVLWVVVLIATALFLLATDTYITDITFEMESLR